MGPILRAFIFIVFANLVIAKNLPEVVGIQKDADTQKNVQIQDQVTNQKNVS